MNEDDMLGMITAATRDERRWLVVRTCRRLQAQLGLQRDSARNQAEHVEALWESSLTRYPGDPASAIRDLHAQLLRTQLEWCAKVWGPLTGESMEILHPLRDVCLYLLIWGELGNLRFCPELGCFLFAAARAFCQKEDKQGRRAWEQEGDQEEEDAEQDAGDGTSKASKQAAFLNGIVKPIFSVFLAETFTPGDPPKSKFGQAPTPARACNYDDWNELFWDPSRLRRCLRLRGDSKAGQRLLKVVREPADVWSKLPEVDWAVSLRYKKSHRELHSLLPLFVGSYRIFMLHSLTFLLILLFTAAENHWGTWMERAGIGLVAPVWMMVYEIGYQVLTPALAWSNRFFGLVKLLFFYMSPIASFVLLFLFERNILKPRFSMSHKTWHTAAIAMHFTLSGLVLLMALTPQRQNRYRWQFYPGLLRLPNCAPTLFWIFVLVGSLGLNFCVIFLCAGSVDSIWALHGGDFAEEWTLRFLLVVQLALLLLPVGLCFFTTMPFFTSVSVAIVGAARGIARLGGIKLFWYRHGVGLTRVPRNVVNRVLQVPHERPSDYTLLKAFKWWNHLSDREVQAFIEVWNAMLDELRERDLLSDAEHGSLAFESLLAVRDGRVPKLLDPLNVFHLRKALPANREAKRRIIALARSAQMQPLPSGVVRDMPTLSVLIPHYSETILHKREDLFTGHGNTELLHYLIKYYRGEFTNFAERVTRAAGVSLAPSAAMTPATSNASGQGRGQRQIQDLDKLLYHWSSLRMQTLWRTVEGVCNAYARALAAVAKQQEPGLSQEEREAMVRDKFQIVLAVQQYHKFADPASPNFDVHQLAAVEAMLHTFGDWLTIAYIEEEKRTGGSRFFSCMIDSSCPLVPGAVTAHRTWQRGEAHVGMRQPKYRIELPGFPILGHGKSDNQNCAVIFTRGEILQMIDANQDAYFEASLFLPLALQEMAGASAKLRGGRRPGIVGFREHIFSDIGLLGRLAADSEFAFGTLVQRTMDSALQARLHYGHPDLLDKLQMVQQGGVSKGTKGLNLSEDIFAGLDLVLRGGWVDYKEYFHVGKGRDMGFMSALSFYAKVSMGNGEQAITRQWMRIGLELPLQRLFGVFYTHVGFYLNQALMTWAMEAFAFMAAFFTLCNPLSLAFADAAAGITSSYFGIFYLLFVLASVLPLLLEVIIEEGLRAAVYSLARSLLSLSPVFAAFQSKLMGHFFISTVYYGGAQYIPTGRGLATAREGFTKLFRTFAASHMHEGAEVALFILFSFGVNYGWAFYICLLLTISSWIFAPFLFNPRQFDDCGTAVQDLRLWTGWMCSSASNEAESWVAWADRLQEVRKNASMLWGIFPSSRLLATVCTTALVLQLTPLPPFEPTVAWVRTLWEVLPPVFHIVPCLLVAPFQNCGGGKGVGPALHVVLAAIAVPLTCLEMSFVPWYPTSALAILFHKYIAVRFFLEGADGIAAHRPGGCLFIVLHRTCRLWSLSFRFPRDFFLGLLLSIINIVLSSVPCLGRVHGVFLFHTSQQKEQRAGAAKKDDDSDFGEGGIDASVHRLLREYAPHALTEAEV